MPKLISNFLIILLIVIGIGLFYLTNKGIIKFGNPFIFQLSADFPAADQVIAIENVNVVPMDSKRLLENQTVIVSDGLIQTLGDSQEVTVPKGALVIDGSRRYLIPGLVDMHVHIEADNDLLLFVANGVTSVRNMWGNTGKKLRMGMPDQLELGQQIEEGVLFGPTIYTTGPVMEGSPVFHPMADAVDLPEGARQSVAWQAAQGYDFIKIYDHLSPEVYQAVLESAAQEGIPVVGHVPFDVGLDGVLGKGQQTIEHLAGYIDSDEAEFIIPEDQLDEYARRTKEAGVWNCVTLSEYPKSKESPEGFQRLQNQPGMAYLSPGWRFISPFLYFMTSRSHTYQGDDYPARMADLNRRMVQALHKSGAGILLGTDAAQAYHIPGFSIHEELEYLVDAGLSPYEALEAGTRNAALVLGKIEEFGSVEVGKRADLILTEGNPLDDVRNIQLRAGVIIRGQWLSEDQLQSMLDGLSDSFKPNFIERIWPLGLIATAAILIWRRLQ